MRFIMRSGIASVMVVTPTQWKNSVRQSRNHYKFISYQQCPQKLTATVPDSISETKKAGQIISALPRIDQHPCDQYSFNSAINPAINPAANSAINPAAEISPCYQSKVLRRRATPARPSRPEPNNQSAAGMGTSVALPLSAMVALPMTVFPPINRLNGFVHDNV